MKSRTKKKGKCSRVYHFTALLLTIVFILVISSNARAENVSILPDNIYVETSTEISTGSRLCWDWQSTLPVHFTVVRSSESTEPLYEKTAASDSTEFIVQKDDTYLMLWLNPNNVSVSLNFTLTVEPGFGSFSLLIAVILVIVFILVFVVLIKRKRKVKGDEKGESQSIYSETQIQSDNGKVMGSPPSFPVEMSPIPRGTRYCPICSNPVTREDTFCIKCGSRLDSR